MDQNETPWEDIGDALARLITLVVYAFLVIVTTVALGG